MKPEDVKDNSLLRAVYPRKKKRDLHKPKAAVGDLVRISKQKGVFEKGFTANWSPELFRVTHVRESDPRTYYLEDLEQVPTRGGLYA